MTTKSGGHDCAQKRKIIEQLITHITDQGSVKELVDMAFKNQENFSIVLKSLIHWENFTSEEKADRIKRTLLTLNDLWPSKTYGKSGWNRTSSIVSTALAAMKTNRHENCNYYEREKDVFKRRERTMKDFLLAIAFGGSMTSVVKSTCKILVSDPDSQPIVKFLYELYSVHVISPSSVTRSMVEALEVRGNTVPNIDEIFYFMAISDTSSFVSGIFVSYSNIRLSRVKDLVENILVDLVLREEIQSQLLREMQNNVSSYSGSRSLFDNVLRRSNLDLPSDTSKRFKKRKKKSIRKQHQRGRKRQLRTR